MPTSSYYNELQITTSSYLEEISDFVMSLGIEAIELKEKTLIIRSEDDLENIQWGVEEFIKKLSEVLNQDLHVNMTMDKKSNEDWIEKYKKSVKPIQIGSFYIRPSWEKPNLTCKNIIIDPALAFGSGHHESTSGCIISLEKYLRKNDKVLDVGSGSGILSIVSAKLGASVDSCDTDTQAVQSTIQNAKLNDVNLNQTWTGSIAKTDKKYDLIVANIIADILIILAKNLRDSLKKDGILILSGILEKYEKRILENFKELIHCETLAKNQWRTIIFKKG